MAELPVENRTALIPSTEPALSEVERGSPPLGMTHALQTKRITNSVIVSETAVTQHQVWLLPSP